MSVHFRLAYGRVRSRYACGIERRRSSVTISSTTKPAAVTCGGCERTDAYRAAAQVAEPAPGGER